MEIKLLIPVIVPVTEGAEVTGVGANEEVVVKVVVGTGIVVVGIEINDVGAVVDMVRKNPTIKV